jgi:chromosome segregation ATPase
MSEPNPTWVTSKINKPKRDDAQLIARLERENHERELLIENMASEIDALHTQTGHYARIIHRRNQEAVGLRDTITSYDKTAQKLRETISTLRVSASDQSKEVERLRTQRGAAWFELHELKQQKISAHFCHESDLVKLLQELEAVKIAKSAISGDLKKAWSQLTALEDERNGLRKTLKMANETTAMAQGRAWDKDKEIKYLKSEIERIKKESQFYISAFPKQKGIIAEKEQSIDQLRATVAEQALEIERLKNPKITIGGVDVPVQLDPTMKPDEWHLRCPGSSSFPPPKMDPEPMQDYRVTTIEGDQYKAHCSIFPKYPTWRENENGHEIDRVIAWTKI